MKYKVTALVALIVGCFFFSHSASADTMAYSVKANIPENQIDKSKTYFDLKMTPGQKQDVSLTISNSSKEKVTIIITPNIAVTNQNGVIDYNQEKVKPDASLKTPITDIISDKQKVTLEPQETKDVVFTLQMPETPFDGTILGGFYVTKEATEKEEKDSESVQIKNRYSYVIGIQLRENEQAVKPVLQLNDVKPTLQNYRTAISANLQNTQATIINDLEVEAKISKKGSTEVLYETTKKDMSMAPNSNFYFPIMMDNQPLKAGKYTLRLSAKDKTEAWKFEQDFDISPEDTKKLNKEAVDLVEEPTDWLKIGLMIGGGVLALLVVVGFVIYRHKKKKKEAERQKRLRKKKQKQKRDRLANEKKTKKRPQ
ncbi:DUF916 and DUF3324 domain-containing protein [Enterococcus crotali]|uniref:DUF916 and DUF3324 domain-containing protein n=1 Tax=Enterococcus crotali TaxID=1453587 RepID=UPI00046F2523|nr:DUF916 and DUF3324 domain-containing protein [Enterococcus crotali]